MSLRKQVGALQKVQNTKQNCNFRIGFLFQLTRRTWKVLDTNKESKHVIKNHQIPYKQKSDTFKLAKKQY